MRTKSGWICWNLNFNKGYISSILTNRKAKINLRLLLMTRGIKDMISTSKSCSNRLTGILFQNLSMNTNQIPLMKMKNTKRTSIKTFISWVKSKRKDMWKSYGEHSKISCLVQLIWWPYLKQLAQRLHFLVRTWVFREKKNKLRKLIFSFLYLISKVHL